MSCQLRYHHTHLHLSLHFTTKQLVLFNACTLRNRAAGPWDSKINGEAEFIDFDLQYYSELSVSQCTEKEIQICFSGSGCSWLFGVLLFSFFMNCEQMTAQILEGFRGQINTRNSHEYSETDFWNQACRLDGILGLCDSVEWKYHLLLLMCTAGSCSEAEPLLVSTCWCTAERSCGCFPFLKRISF